MLLSVAATTAVAVAVTVTVTAKKKKEEEEKEEKEEVNTDDDDIEEVSRLKIEPKYCIFCISVTFDIFFCPFSKARDGK